MIFAFSRLVIFSSIVFLLLKAGIHLQKSKKGSVCHKKLLRQGTALKHCFRPQEPRIQNGRPRVYAGVTIQVLDQAFLTVSTRAAKLLGSLMAISDSILRFSSMPAFFRPAMKVE